MQTHAINIDYEIKILTLDDKENIVNFQKLAKLELGDGFQVLADKYYLPVLTGNLSLGLFVNGEMIGMRLGYKATSQRHGTNTDAAIFCGAYVAAPFRQRKFGKILIKEAITLAKQQGLTHIYGTVHPCNYPSLYMLLSCGFLMIDVGIKYEDKLRYTAYLNANENPIQKNTRDTSIIVDQTDIEKQKELFDAGYIGMNVTKHLDKKQISLTHIEDTNFLNFIKKMGADFA